MKSPLKTLSRETAVYGVSTVVGRFLNFLLVPFYVNVLPTRAEYGFVSSLYAYMAFLSVVFPLGLEGAYFRYAARAEGEAPESERERRLFSTPFWLIFGFGLAAAGAILIFSRDLVSPAFSSPAGSLSAFFPALLEMVRLSAAILFLDALAVIPFACLRLQHRAGAFSWLKVGNIVGTLVLNFVFVLRLRWGIAGIFRANAITSLATLAVLLPLTRRELGLRFDRSVLARILPFGLANVPAYLGAMIVQVIDRPIVQRLRGFSELGVYQANYRMGVAMMVLVSVFDYAWRPFFLRQYATDGDAARPLFARVFTYAVFSLLAAYVVLSFFLPWFVGVRLPWIHRSLLRPDYLSGVGVIPVVLLAYVFQGLATNFMAGVYIREMTSRLPIVTGIGAAVNVAANLLLIPHFGILGAAYATLAAYVAMAGALFYFSQRVFPVPYEWGRLARIGAVAACAAVAGRFVPAGPARIALAAAALAALTAAAILRRPALSESV